MHAFLIVGKDSATRLKEAEKLLSERGLTEVVRLNSPEKTHSIESIRDIQRQLSIAASNREKGRGLLVEDAHLLTAEAANAFLKTLEEPPGKTTIVLTAPNGDAVLETISSRATAIELGASSHVFEKNEEEKSRSLLETFLSGELGEKLAFVDKTSRREEARDFCVGQIFASRNALRAQVKSGKGKIPQAHLIELLERLEQARQDLEANVNVKLVLGELLLHYPREKKLKPEA